MKTLKLMALAAMAMFAFAAVGTAAANAEAEAKILCLVAKCAEQNSVVMKGGESRLTTLGSKEVVAKELKGTEVETTIKAGTCADPTNEGKDCTLLKDIPIVFKGVELVGGTSKCKTGTAALGTVESLLDLHLAAEKTSAGELEPLLLAKVLSSEKKPGLIIKCGVLIEEVKGTIGCLLLGLKNITAEELTCAFNAATHDPETGECEFLCELLKEDPFLSNLGNGAEDAWMKIKLTGSFEKDIFIDD